MVFDRKTLVIPDNTVFNEDKIITSGDVIIGDRCLVEFGIKTNGRIFVGEHVIIDGDLEASNDIRIDLFSRVRGNVKSNANVYLGEKVTVDGHLSVGGDLDVGDSVEVKKGFEAKGWINIRSPIPIVIYIFIYLIQLLKMGHSEEIERILREMEENEGDTIPISEVFLFIPNNSILGIQKSKTDYSLRIGRGSRIIGNFESKGKVFIGDDTVIHGSIKASDDIFCGKNVDIKGSLFSHGDIRIDEDVSIGGNVTGKHIYLPKSSSIRGTLFGEHGITFISPFDYQAAEAMSRFEEEIEVFEESR